MEWQAEQLHESEHLVFLVTLLFIAGSSLGADRCWKSKISCIMHGTKQHIPRASTMLKRGQLLGGPLDFESAGSNESSQRCQFRARL